MNYLATEPISWEQVGELHRKAAHEEQGALVIFVGSVRNEYAHGRKLKTLFYEAYAEMAEFEIDRWVTQAKARWPLLAVQIQHRLGAVRVGQISVVIAVATSHRAEAYAASRFLMDKIKQQVPIWKKEQYTDGTSQWVTCAHVNSIACKPC